MNALKLVHNVLAEHIKCGEYCIDATAGRGYDTAFLCRLVGENGKVIAFDIQQDAIKSTRDLLDREMLSADLHLESHENMGKYAEEGTVSAIVFNLGYLPNGNHNIFTHFVSTQKAIIAGLKLLKPNGLMCISIYHGGATGYEERDSLLKWLKVLDPKYYQVLVVNFYNWMNDPPIPVFIRKNE